MSNRRSKKKRNGKLDNVIPYIRKRMTSTHIAIAVIAVLVLIICLVNAYSAGKAYTGYDIMNSVTRNDGDNASYLQYGDGYIRYSNDGIAYYKQSGSVVWNYTYEINNAQVKMCGDYIVVGNITGRNLFIYNKSGLQSEIDAAMTITQVDVANQGVVAVALEDGNTNYINMYDASGNKLSYIITSLDGDGYPVDMAISNDGSKLVVSYVSVSGESLKSNVAFYNFSDVGQNLVDRLVGGFNHYESSLVGKVEFVDNTNVIAVAEDRVTFFEITQYPEKKEEIMLEQELQKITYNDQYIGLIFNNADSIDKHKMQIYNMKGQKISELLFGEDYRNYEFHGDYILLYNEKLFTLLSIKGKVKYQNDFDMAIAKIIPLDKNQRFLVFNSKYIQEIKLN